MNPPFNQQTPDKNCVQVHSFIHSICSQRKFVNKNSIKMHMYRVRSCRESRWPATDRRRRCQ